MSEQENVNQNPAAADPAAVRLAVAEALSGHADALHPGASDQLARLLADDLKDCPPRLVGELVRARIGSDEYKHFRRPAGHPAGRPAQPQPPAAATAPSENDLISGIKARFQASRSENFLGGGPGLGQ